MRDSQSRTAQRGRAAAAVFVCLREICAERYDEVVVTLRVTALHHAERDEYEIRERSSAVQLMGMRSWYNWLDILGYHLPSERNPGVDS